MKFVVVAFMLYLYCSISYWFQSCALSPVLCSAHRTVPRAYPKEPKLGNYLEGEKPVH